MKKIISKNNFILIIFLILFIGTIIPISSAYSVDLNSELIKFNEKAQLGGNAETDPIKIIVNIINIILGLLGLFFTVLVMFNGFRYMTAGGKADTAKEALNSIRDAIIGVAIIFASYVIVNYVIINILKAITDTTT